MKTLKITCRKGVEYTVEAGGTTGECARLKDLLEHCCCFVCYNSDCKNPEEVKIACNKECGIFVSEPYCERKK